MADKVSLVDDADAQLYLDYLGFTVQVHEERKKHSSAKAASINVFLIQGCAGISVLCLHKFYQYPGTVRRIYRGSEPF